MAKKSIGILNIVFGADLRGFDRAMKKAQRSITKFGNKMGNIGKNLTRNLTLPILALGAVSVRSFDKQQKAIAQVEAGLKSTGNQVGKTSQELQKMAADLQKTTLFGDEEILQGATAQLLTFTNIAGKQFERTQKIALDLATRLDGDLKSASIMLGKALNDPVANLSALSRAGIQFSIEQKKTIKSLVETNRLADAQTIILAELEKQYGGSAAAAREAGLGPIQALQNTLMDLTEDIGKIILPSLIALAKKIETLAIKFDTLSDKTKVNIVKWLAFAAALGPVVIGVSKIILAFSYLLPWIHKIGKAIMWLGAKMLTMIIRNPWLLLATAIAAVGVTIADSMGAFDKWLGKTDEIEDETDDAIQGVDGLTKELDDLDNTLTKDNKTLEDFILNLGKVTDATQQAVIGIPFLLDPKSAGAGAPVIGPKEQTAAEYWESQLEKTRLKFEELNAVTALFGDVMHNAMMDAANSQEGFFQSLFENLKRAIKQMLIQLAVLTAINLMLGGKGTTVMKAFGLAKGKLLGIPAGANGLLATGPTLALVGEGSGTSMANPEVVAPLDKLKSYIGGGDMRVTGRLVGNDIFLSNEKAGVSRNRFV